MTGCAIGDNAVLGKQPMLSARSTAKRTPLEPLRLGARCRVSAGAVLSAGATLGDDCVVGDLATVRERVTIGDGVVIGRGVCVENDTTIGRGTKIQTNAYITAYCTLEDDVFIAPCVVTTNDNFMGRTERRHALIKGAVVRRGRARGRRRDAPAGVEIGEEAFVGARRAGAARRPAAHARGRLTGSRAARGRGRRAAREPVARATKVSITHSGECKRPLAAEQCVLPPPMPRLLPSAALACAFALLFSPLWAGRLRRASTPPRRCTSTSPSVTKQHRLQLRTTAPYDFGPASPLKSSTPPAPRTSPRSGPNARGGCRSRRRSQLRRRARHGTATIPVSRLR